MHKETAANLKDRLQRIHQLLDDESFSALMDGHTREREAWAKRIHQLEHDINQPPETPIAMVGSTGAGKSTLLNALLGAQILPTSDRGKACTSAITSVRYAPGDTFSARIHFLTLEEWNRELDALKNSLQTEFGEEERSDITDWNDLKRATQEKIRTVYGLQESEIEDGINFQDLKLPDSLHQWMVSSAEPLHIMDANAKELRSTLKQYLTGEGSYWPVVKSVEVSGPFEALRNGVVIIDLPGVNDPNPAREEVTRKYLRDAPYVWVVFNMNRGMTKDIHDLLIEQKMLRQFLYEGKVDALTLVGTAADAVDEGNVEDYGLEDDAEIFDIIQARNNQVKVQVGKDLHDIAGKLAGAARESGESLSRLRKTLHRTSIYTVSAFAYMNLLKVRRGRSTYGMESVEDTELPQLIKHIETISRSQDYISEIGQKVTLLVSEMENFFRSRRAYQENRRGEFQEQLTELRQRLERPRQDLDADLKRARGRCEESFRAHKEIFEQRLKIAVDTAHISVNRVVDSWLGIHWATLKAVIVRDGSFVSPSTGKRHDLNADIAEPLLNAIPFVWDDFFGYHLKANFAELKGELQGRSEVFLERLRSEARIAGVFGNAVLNNISGDIEVSRQTLELQIQETLNGLNRTISRKRGDLVSSITDIIQAKMQSAYAKAKQEQGSGMKRRMLATLQSFAVQSVKGMYETIQQDLLEGIEELGVQFGYELTELTKQVCQQADRVLMNLGVGSLGSQSEDNEELIKIIDAMLDHLKNLRPHTIAVI
jgi:hypothetical protein